MKDLIIGCIVNYLPQDIAPWVNSIRMCGFTGDVAVIDFGCHPDMLWYLRDNGIQVYHGELNGRHIVVERFIHMYQLLREHLEDYRFVIATDVKDVVFNKNPSDAYEMACDSKYNWDFIVKSPENVLYEDEPWGDNNMRVSYPHMYERMKNRPIYNAGVIAGTTDLIADLFLHIYHLSLIGGDPQPDQAAYNILLDSLFYEDMSMMFPVWAAQIGTNLDMTLEDIQLYYIIHQYDRVPHLKQAILEIYSNERKDSKGA